MLSRTPTQVRTVGDLETSADISDTASSVSDSSWVGLTLSDVMSDDGDKARIVIIQRDQRYFTIGYENLKSLVEKGIFLQLPLTVYAEPLDTTLGATASSATAISWVRFLLLTVAAIGVMYTVLKTALPIWRCSRFLITILTTKIDASGEFEYETKSFANEPGASSSKRRSKASMCFYDCDEPPDHPGRQCKRMEPRPTITG